MANINSPLDLRWAKFQAEHKAPVHADGTPLTFEETDAHMHKTLLSGQLPGPTDVTITEDKTSMVPIFIYTPPNTSKSQSLPCFIYFHGGGFTYLSVSTFDPIHRKMAKAGNCIVVAPEYTVCRESADTKFPRAVNEAYDSYLWVLKNAEKYNINPNRVFIGGGSCGATFAAVACLMARDNKLDIRPRGQILLSPFFTPNCETPSWMRFGRGYNNNIEGALRVWKNYQSKPEDQLNPYFSPLRAESLADLPKALIIMGEHDPITDDGIIYHHKLKRAGIDTVSVVYQDMPHVHLSQDAVFPSECKSALAQIVSFIQE